MFNKIKKLFSKNSFTKKEKDFSFNPDKNWKTLFLLFLVGNLMIFSLLTVFYFRINKDETLRETDLAIETKFVDEELLDDVLEVYVLKAEKLNILMESVPLATDPSI